MSAHATGSSNPSSLRETLARVQELSLRLESSKHQQIRVSHWVRKLLAQPASNATWMKNVQEYAHALLQMLLRGALDEPFTKMPPQGPLPTLPRHTKRVQSQQVQTSEGEDQWEWQRVWKGAFEKIRRELEGTAKQNRALELEVKELRAVLKGYEKSLEREIHAREELQTQHQAQVNHLRAVHDLELQELKAQHRKKIQEVTVQNDRELQRRRRDEQLQHGGGAFNAHSDSYGDFLAYIDAFHMDTLALTMRLQP